MWTYSQGSGKLRDPNGVFIGVGYSGYGIGINDAQEQSVPDVGPIPQGIWTIGTAYSDSEKGPLVMPLTPQEGTETFRRRGFLIHGDEIGHVGENLASHGCIILNHALRQTIADSEDRVLEVTS